MILFRECLKHDIVPIIIKDETKVEYYHVLHDAQVNKNYDPINAYAKKQQMICREELAPFIVEELESEQKQSFLQKKMLQDRMGMEIGD